MLGVVSTFMEMALMVLEPMYRSYKELKAVDGGGGGGDSGLAGTAAEVGTETTETTITSSSAATEEEQQQRRQQQQGRLGVLLMHWIVFGVFRGVEWFVSPLPLYNTFKIGAIVWLRVGGGTETVYRKFIEPFFAQNEPIVDQWLERCDRARDTVVTTTAALGDIGASGNDDPTGTDGR